MCRDLQENNKDFVLLSEDFILISGLSLERRFKFIWKLVNSDDVRGKVLPNGPISCCPSESVVAAWSVTETRFVLRMCDTGGRSLSLQFLRNYLKGYN